MFCLVLSQLMFHPQVLLKAMRVSYYMTTVAVLVSEHHVFHLAFAFVISLCVQFSVFSLHSLLFLFSLSPPSFSQLILQLKVTSKQYEVSTMTTVAMCVTGYSILVGCASVFVAWFFSHLPAEQGDARGKSDTVRMSNARTSSTASEIGKPESMCVRVCVWKMLCMNHKQTSKSECMAVVFTAEYG